MTGYICDGTLPPGMEVEIRVAKDGLEIECFTIPWEWIDEARKTLLRLDQ